MCFYFCVTAKTCYVTTIFIDILQNNNPPHQPMSQKKP